MKLNNDQRIVMQAVLDGKNMNKIDTSPEVLRGLAHYWDGLLVDCPFATQCGNRMADVMRAVAAEKEAQAGAAIAKATKKKTMKVAVFTHRDISEWCCPMRVDYVFAQPDAKQYIQLSDIVEIEYEDKS